MVLLKKNVAIFGTGSYMTSKVKAIREKFNIMCFADNDSSKWGAKIHGIDIINPKELKNYQWDNIIIASSYFFEISKQLVNMGIDNTDILLLQNFKPYSEDEKLFFRQGNEQFFIDTRGNACFKNDLININFYTMDDYYVIKEIFADGVYDFNDYSDNEYSVIDIGMNIGTASIYFASKSNVKNVYSFEPFSETFNLALNNISINDVIGKKVHSYRYGLSNADKNISLFYNENQKSGMSTQEDINTKFCGNSNEKQEICLKDSGNIINKIIQENNNSKFILKVDCEGEEYNIFKRLNEIGIVGKFQIIMLEWHYQGSELLETILKENKFIYFKFVRDIDTGVIYAIKSN